MQRLKNDEPRGKADGECRKMIWNEIVKPNCIRDKRSAVGSLAVILPLT
jgi:hypothetical protein